MSRRNKNTQDQYDYEFVFEGSAYVAPKIIENKTEDWVEYGEDNNYFQFLIDRYNGSTTNQAIIRGISNMIYGKGLDALDSSRKPDQYLEMRMIVDSKANKAAALDRKMLGMAALQVTYNKSKRVNKITHLPMNTLRPSKMNKEGEIEYWYYSADWTDIKKYPPEKIFAFGKGDKKKREVYIVAPYVTGQVYFAPPDYQGALPYAMLEEEIADYLINDVKNGFSGTKIVNFNNGEPNAEKRKEIRRDVVNKLTGSKGQKVIVAFNKDETRKATIDDIPLNDAPGHYEYLSKECFNKLIVGHGVTSPMMLGVRDGSNGLGNNAEEIKNANITQDNLTVKPFQLELIDAYKDILAVNGISLDLYYRTIQPLEFIETDGLDAKTKEEETGIKMTSHVACSADGSDQEQDDTVAKELIDRGQEINLNEWELMSSEEVDYQLEDEIDEYLKSNKVNHLLFKLSSAVSTGTARPNAKSEQDKEIDGVKYIVRYKYAPESVSTNSRKFCKKMVQANKLYRKEDIIAMGDKVVNEVSKNGVGWGAKGAEKYSIWLYKGGGACHHRWLRQTFRSTVKIDVRNPNAPKVSTNKAEREGFRVRNPKEVAMKPIDMAYEGFLPTNKRFN